MRLSIIGVLVLVLACYGGIALLIWKDRKKQKLQVNESPMMARDISRQIEEQENRR